MFSNGIEELKLGGGVAEKEFPDNQEKKIPSIIKPRKKDVVVFFLMLLLFQSIFKFTEMLLR